MAGLAAGCRACGGRLAVTMADLGMQPPSNAFLPSIDAARDERRYPLRAKVCEVCRLVQVDYDVAPEELFRNYVYFSSYSDEWLAHAKRYCEMARRRFALDERSLVVELASNDGYLLKNFLEMGIPVLGIDPSDTVAQAALRIGVPTMVRFFGEALARELEFEGRRADLIIANNVLAHVPQLNDFIAGIALLLKPEGTATLEFPHLLRLIEQVEFDTIYHEHYSYISLCALERVFARHGLRIYDAEELPTHGGSLRIFAAHTGAAPEERAGVRSVRSQEAAAGLDDLETYRRFAARVEECRRSLLEFLARAKSAGETVAGYGAAAKGNTLLNYCGVTCADISMVADRNPHKQSMLLPGTHVPVVSPAQLMRSQPHYVLVLPWNLLQEIRLQLADIRAWGGCFVTAIPEVRIHA